jgi:hypothetical protein
MPRFKKSEMPHLQKAFVNKYLFARWLKGSSVPRKLPVSNLSILDGHASHCSSQESREVTKR